MITSKTHSPSATRKIWATTAWVTMATHLKTGVEINQLNVTSILEMNTMMKQTWVVTKHCDTKRRANQAAQEARYKIEQS
jgi:hypothetical protein